MTQCSNDGHIEGPHNNVLIQTHTGENGYDMGALKQEYFSETLDTLSSITHESSPSFEGQMDHKLPTASRAHLDTGERAKLVEEKSSSMVLKIS